MSLVAALPILPIMVVVLLLAAACYSLFRFLRPEPRSFPMPSENSPFPDGPEVPEEKFAGHKGSLFSNWEKLARELREDELEDELKAELGTDHPLSPVIDVTAEPVESVRQIREEREAGGAPGGKKVRWRKPEKVPSGDRLPSVPSVETLSNYDLLQLFGPRRKRRRRKDPEYRILYSGFRNKNRAGSPHPTQHRS